jgi:hypothetical protein
MLGIVNLLRNGPRSASDLSASLAVDPRALYRLL